MDIVIADDSLASRKMLQSILIQEGYKTFACESGTEVLKRYESPNPPGLAILDWVMPECDGIEVCQRIRAQKRFNHVYIILVTAKTEKEDVIEGLEAGANDYVTKPYDRRELIARIRVGERVIGLQTELAKKIVAVNTALHQVRTLQGVIPICMHCHRIRNDKQAWEQMERYVEQHSEAQFSHGLCPDCTEKEYPASRV